MSTLPAATTSHDADLSDPAWRALLRFAALVNLGSAVLMMALGRFVGPSLVVLALAMGTGVWLLRRPGRAAAVVIGLFSLASLLLHGPIMVLQLSLPDSPGSFVTGLGMGLGSLLGVVCAGAVLVRMRGSARLSQIVVRATAAVLVSAVVVSLVLFATRTSDTGRPGDLRLATTGQHLSTQRLTASPGVVSIAVRNTDPVFPRSFDIDTLHVHVLVPPRTTRRVSFSAAGGRYRFSDNATATEATTGELVVSR